MQIHIDSIRISKTPWSILIIPLLAAVALVVYQSQMTADGRTFIQQILNRPIFSDFLPSRAPQDNTHARSIISSNELPLIVNTNSKKRAINKPKQAISLALSSGMIQVKNSLEVLRKLLLSTLQKYLPPRESLLSFSVLFGNSSIRDKTFEDEMRKVGVSHVFSASGFNVLIVVAVLRQLFRFVPNKFIQMLFMLSGIWIYCIFAGLSPSIWRAGIMSSLFLTSKQFGRQYFPLLALSECTVLLLIIDRATLFTISYALSSASTLGLLFLLPPLEKITKPLNRGILAPFVQDGVASAAASIATLPISTLFFRQISLVAIFTNFLLLWLVPWIMLFSSLVLVTHFLFPIIAPMLSFLLFACSHLFVVIVEWVSGINNVSVNLTSFQTVTILICCIAASIHRILVVIARKRRINLFFRQRGSSFLLE